MTDLTDLRDLPPLRSLPPARVRGTRQALVAEVLPARPVHRRRRPLGFAAAGAMLLTAAVAGGIVLFGRSTPAAAWVAVPDAVAAAETSQLAGACRQSIAARHLPMALGAPGAALAERRGSFRSVLVPGAADRTAVCAVQSTGGTGSSWGFQGIYGVGPARGPLTVDAVPGTSGGSDAARVVFGRVAPSVTAVTVDTADGRHVTASLGHGRYLAWWPTGAGVARVTALDQAGNTVATVEPPAESATVTPTQQG